MDHPVKEGEKNLVQPLDPLKHASYSFKVTVFLEGGSKMLFGPYTLNVGCL